MGNMKKWKAEILKGNPYIGVCFQALETLEHLWLIEVEDYCQTKALNLTLIETKEIGTKLLILVCIE